MAKEKRVNQNLEDEISRLGVCLAEFDDERARISRRISELKAKLTSLHMTEEQRRPTPSTSEQKVALFMELFHGRSDVYPQRWVNIKKGTEGYSPACSNEWIHGVCDKRRVKCSECPNRAFIPVTENAVHDHLQGRHVIGVYPMLSPIPRSCSRRCEHLATFSVSHAVPGHLFFSQKPMPEACPVYRPRKPHLTPFYQCVQDHYEILEHQCLCRRPHPAA